jgi:tetratricopeptide (TPR) repeat protein
LGRIDEAKKELNESQWLDPVSPRICFLASHPFFYNGEFERAAEQLRKAIELDPNYGSAFEQLVRIHEEQGEYQKAIEMFQKAAVLGGSEQAKVAQKADELQDALSTGKATGYWQKKLEQTGLGSLLGFELYDIAVIYLHLGEWERVFEYLEKAEAAKSDFVFFIKIDKRFDGLRSDPRFKALLRKLAVDK